MRERRVRLPALASGVAELVDGALQGRGRYHQKIHVLGEMGKTIALRDRAGLVDVLGYDPQVDLLRGHAPLGALVRATHGHAI